MAAGAALFGRSGRRRLANHSGRRDGRSEVAEVEPHCYFARAIRCDHSLLATTRRDLDLARADFSSLDAQRSLCRLLPKIVSHHAEVIGIVQLESRLLH